MNPKNNTYVSSSSINILKKVLMDLLFFFFALFNHSAAVQITWNQNRNKMYGWLQKNIKQWFFVCEDTDKYICIFLMNIICEFFVVVAFHTIKSKFLMYIDPRLLYEYNDFEIHIFFLD